MALLAHMTEEVAALTFNVDANTSKRNSKLVLLKPFRAIERVKRVVGKSCEVDQVEHLVSPFPITPLWRLLPDLRPQPDTTRRSDIILLLRLL